MFVAVQLVTYLLLSFDFRCVVQYVVQQIQASGVWVCRSPLPGGVLLKVADRMLSTFTGVRPSVSVHGRIRSAANVACTQDAYTRRLWEPGAL